MNPRADGRLHGLDLPPRYKVRNAPLLAARLELTPIDPADGPELWDVIEASRPELAPWLPWVPYNTGPDASQRFAEASALDWDAGRALRFGIRAIPTGELLGVLSLESISRAHRLCDLGYWLATRVSGRGLMTEAVRSLLRYSFEQIGFHRVRCAAASDNHKSLGVIARLGFRFEGLARDAEFVNSRWVDHAVFSLLDSDSRL